MDNQNQYPKLRVQLLSENAKMPNRGSDGSSGLDVFSTGDYTVPPGKDVLIPLDLRFEIPYGWDLVCNNKSGVSTKLKLVVGAEIIDSDYRGNCHAHVFNLGDSDVFITKGQKLIQLIMREVWMGELEQVESISTETVRGAGGFGSTGTH